MIILDTNVVSETLKPLPAANVVEWMRAEAPMALFITTITEAELLFGLALLPQGNRRHALEALILPLLDEDFAGRILPFDGAAAREFAEIAVHRRRSGKPISDADGRIAAVARSRGADLATRDIAGFADCGVELINPWA